MGGCEVVGGGGAEEGEGLGGGVVGGGVEVCRGGVEVACRGGAGGGQGPVEARRCRNHLLNIFFFY